LRDTGCDKEDQLWCYDLIGENAISIVSSWGLIISAFTKTFETMSCPFLEEMVEINPPRFRFGVRLWAEREGLNLL
jgi:hypothetical protein